MPPKSWTDANRGSVQLIVIHTTEGSAHSQSAEDGAAYDQRRTDGTSTHYFHDSDSTVQCVRTADIAHTARTQGNKRGIQHELCGKGGSIDWSGGYAQAMLKRAAKQCARDAEKWGIPIRKLSAGQVADGVKGFCGHVDITNAFPQDNGDHTDPGSRFPWSQFLGFVQEELESDMALSDSDKAWLKTEIDRAATVAAERVWSTQRNIGGPGPVYMAPLGGVLGNMPFEHGTALQKLDEIIARVSALDVPVVTKETVRAAMIDIITGAA
jgi:hypothetical protein